MSSETIKDFKFRHKISYAKPYNPNSFDTTAHYIHIREIILYFWLRCNQFKYIPEDIRYLIISYSHYPSPASTTSITSITGYSVGWRSRGGVFHQQRYQKYSQAIRDTLNRYYNPQTIDIIRNIYWFLLLFQEILMKKF